jgi:hypothetical protein
MNSTHSSAILSLLLIICLVAGSADASPRHFGGTAAPQSVGTVFASTDCSPAINITNGGLTLSSTTASIYYGDSCRSTNPKFTGEWYYEVTTGGAGDAEIQGVGFANGSAYLPPIFCGWSLTGATETDCNSYYATLGNTTSTVGFTYTYGSGSSALNWNNAGLSALPGVVTGQTIGVAVDLDTDPPQVWVTPNVSNLVCNGSGASGSTAPQWNGSCADDPSLMGTGRPTTGGTGLSAFLPGNYAWSPTFQIAKSTGASTETATFNFGASPFVGTVPRGGYQAWNAAGGGPTVPGPLNPMDVNIANAPGWQASHSYVAGDRITAGPAWNGSAYTSGSPLYLWATTTVSGTSGSSASVFSSCPSPANVGGGLVNPTSAPSGWASATHVTDGGVTWVCLTPVDYVTMTGFVGDDPLTWASGQPYYRQTVVFNGYSWLMVTPISSPSYLPCISGSTGPAPAAQGTDVSDGNCTWESQGPITYSSLAHRWPHSIDFGPADEVNFNFDLNVTLWYGGAERQVYQPGYNGETDPILIWNHADAGAPTDAISYCRNGWGLGSRVGSAINYSCPGTYTTFDPAPGDSFRDNVTAASGPLSVDQTKGVTFYENVAQSCNFTNFYTQVGADLGISDYQMTFERLQFQSVQGSVADSTYCGPGYRVANVENFYDDIMDAGGGTGILSGDCAYTVGNSVMIYRGTTNPIAYGFSSAYPSALYNDTIIGPGVTNCPTCSALQLIKTDECTYGQGGGGYFFPPPLDNLAVFGWGSPVAVNLGGFGWSGVTYNAQNNATDVASSFTGGTVITTPNPSGQLTTANLSGVGNTCTPASGNTSSCYGLTPANEFVCADLTGTTCSPLDLRLKSTADIYNAGANFSFPTNTVVPGTLAPGADIFGTARPQSGGRYDIGAVEYP